MAIEEGIRNKGIVEEKLNFERLYIPHICDYTSDNLMAFGSHNVL
jgi:hypothetical protein